MVAYNYFACTFQEPSGGTNCRVIDEDVLDELEKQILDECHEATITVKPVKYL
jgi:hypothetical protein